MRLVRQLRAELGTDDGTVKRVAGQLGYGTESVRAWVRQADIDDGGQPGTTTGDRERLKVLGWRTPAEALDEHLRSLQQADVASTG